MHFMQGEIASQGRGFSPRGEFDLIDLSFAENSYTAGQR